MNYKETLDYLYAKLPMFTRVGSTAIRPGLKNIEAFCSKLGSPEKKFKSIHIGGTNGKGSTSHMLASIFQKAGYKTGLYTSPHLVDFRERIRVNGTMIPQTEVVNFVESNKDYIESLQPSFFEVTVALAFNYFAEQEVDIAIIEVGLGGRLDSTNIIQPELSIITNISKDHTNLLGNTLGEIANEKAGIIKENTPVIIGEYAEETAPVFQEKAESTSSKILFANQQYSILVNSTTNSFLSVDVYKGEKVYLKNLELDLTGTYQSKNILGVIAAVDLLNLGGWTLSEQHLRDALKEVKSATGLLGRWHKLSDNPLSYCDTGHNEAGIQEVLKNIDNITYTNLHFVIGMVKDKDISTVLSLLPKKATYYFCKPEMERGMDPVELQQMANKYNLTGNVCNSVPKAYESAQQNCAINDLIFVGGSTFVVAEII